MDGGSNIIILYYEAFRGMGLTQKQLQPSETVFHDIVPGKSARPIGKIYLETAFGNTKNFRSEIIPFEVVNLESPYHAILGRPTYARSRSLWPNHSGWEPVQGYGVRPTTCQIRRVSMC